MSAKPPNALSSPRSIKMESEEEKFNRSLNKRSSNINGRVTNNQDIHHLQNSSVSSNSRPSIVEKLATSPL